MIKSKKILSVMLLSASVLMPIKAYAAHVRIIDNTNIYYTGWPWAMRYVVDTK